MPSRMDYNRAILLSQARLKVSDPDLREGQVQTVMSGTTAMPWGNQGGFAVVYKFRTKSGQDRALRCFTRAMNPDTRQRYELIGPYFRSRAPDITADFVYYDQGIEVEESVLGHSQIKTYPVIAMEWVEGVTLFDHVETLCKQQNQAALGDLARKWFDLTQQLRQATIGHGDLAAVNVMVRNNGRLVLVDYDGVYIPSFRGKTQPLFGTRGFQHPQMGQRPFDEWMDEFSALVIYTALVALQAQPTLWDTHVKYGSSGRALDQTLLFTHEDFEHPQQSALFNDLERSPHLLVREATRFLKQACGQAVAKVRFPVILGDADYVKQIVLKTLVQAIKDNNDEQIEKLWEDGMDRYPPAQPYRTRWQLAKDRMQALETFRQALQSRSLRRILADYKPGLLDPCKSITPDEKEKLRLAKQLDAALQATVVQDEQVVAAWNAIERLPSGVFLTLTAAEQQQLDGAQHRKRQIDAYRAALQGGSIEQITLACADPALRTYQGITTQDMQIMDLAQAFSKARRDNDDEAIVAAAVKLLNLRINNQPLPFSPEEGRRVELARKTNDGTKKYLEALKTRDTQKIAEAYDPALLARSKGVTSEQRQVGEAMKGLEEEYQQNNDDDRFLQKWEIAQRFQALVDFLPAQIARVGRAKQRKAAIAAFKQALLTKNIQQIVAAYKAHNQIIVRQRNLSVEERAVLDRAEAFAQACQDDDDDAIEAEARRIGGPALSAALRFTPAEEQRIQQANKRKAAYDIFQHALNSRKAEEIVRSYDAYLLDPYKGVPQAERDRLAAAKRFNQMRREVVAAIRGGDPARAYALYDEPLAQQFDDFTEQERKQIASFRLVGQLEHGLATGDDELALQAARELEKTTGYVTGEPLRQVRRRFVRSCHPRNVKLEPDGSRAHVWWDWPDSEFIQTVVVVWRPDRFPRNAEDAPSGVQRTVCPRKGISKQGTCTITVGNTRKAYVQVFAAMQDAAAEPGKPVWYYSDGQEATSKQVI